MVHRSFTGRVIVLAELVSKTTFGYKGHVGALVGPLSPLLRSIIHWLVARMENGPCMSLAGAGSSIFETRVVFDKASVDFESKGG